MKHPSDNPGVFPQTRWSLVLNAHDPKAMAELCQTYWLPIFTYARRLRPSTHDAEDLTQVFFSHLLSKGGFDTTGQNRGKLRNFLLRSLKIFPMPIGGKTKLKSEARSISYRDLLKETIAEIVTTSEQVEEKLRDLRAVFGD